MGCCRGPRLGNARSAAGAGGQPAAAESADPSGARRRWLGLGLTPLSYVVWMPTYRAPGGTFAVRAGRTHRFCPSRLPGDAADPVTEVAELARSIGVTVVVKPHPADVDRYGQSGLRVLSTEQVFAAGLTLYQFIGASAGMISDYSSVWVEYLDTRSSASRSCARTSPSTSRGGA